MKIIWHGEMSIINPTLNQKKTCGHDNSLKYAYQKIPLMLMVCIAVIMIGVSQVNAHLPHDDITLMKMSPNYHNDNTLMIAIRNNLLRSNDGGNSWKRLVNGLSYTSQLTSIAIPDDFDESKIIFVATENEGIFKSEDGGESWMHMGEKSRSLSINQVHIPKNYKEKQMLFLTSRQGGLFKMQSDGNGLEAVPGSETKIITAIAEAEKENGQKFLIGDSEGFIYVYEEEQNTWEEVSQFSEGGAVTTIGLPPGLPFGDEFFFGTEKNGLMKGSIQGSFDEIPDLPKDNSVVSIAFSPDYYDDSKIFVTTWEEAVYMSNDGGQSWEKHSEGLTKDKQAYEGQLSHFRDIEISKNFNSDKTLFINGFDGLFKSIDGGLSWRQVETIPASVIVGFDVSPAYEDAPKVVLSNYAGAIYMLDRTNGEHWEVLNRDLGYIAIRITAACFSPDYQNDDTIFSTSDDSFLISRDSGQSWQVINIRDIYWMPYKIQKLLGIGRFSKTEFNRPWIPTLIAPSPIYSADQTIFLSTRINGVCRSTDGGKSFKLMWTKDPDQIDSIVFSPDYAKDGTLFLSAPMGHGVYISRNRGETWLEAGNGLEYEKGKVIMAISPDFHNDGTLFSGTNKGIFKSVDMGEKWYKLPDPSGETDYVEAIAISPNYKNDRELIISIMGKGLFKSNDAGKTFRPIATDLIKNNHSLTPYQDFPERPAPIKYSPFYATDRTIYGVSGEELFISEDAGESWHVIKRPVRYEDIRHDVIVYKNRGDWKRIYKPDQFKGHKKISASNISVTDSIGATATFPFFGTGVTWLGAKSKDQGIAKVYVDGIFRANVDQYSPVPKTGEELFSIQNLSRGSHEIKIEVSGDKNEESTGHNLIVDAFDVLL